VSPSGNDGNTGGIEAPWATIARSVGKLRPGDTLYLRGGIYTGIENTIDSEIAAVPSGTSGSMPITIGGYPSEAVIIRPPGNGFGIRLTRTAPRYLIFQDFTIDMPVHRGDLDSAPSPVYLSGGANHNRFLRLDIQNSSNFGVVFSTNNGNSPFNEVVNCRIHNNGFPGGQSTNGHGLYITTSDNLIASNEIFDNEGFGVHLYNNAGPLDVARNIVRNNHIYNNGRHGGSAYGIVVAWGDGNQIYDNIVERNPGGIFVYLATTNTVVRNNTVSANRPLAGILVQDSKNTTIRDNVVSGNGVDIEDFGSGTNMTNNRLTP